MNIHAFDNLNRSTAIRAHVKAFSLGMLGSIWAIAGSALGAPTPQSVTGVATHGVAVSLAGSGFGTRADNNSSNLTWKGHRFLAFRFKDFEDGLLNSEGFYPQSGGGVWNPSASDLGILSGGPTNSTKYLRRAIVANGENGGLSADNVGDPKYFYTKFKFKVPANCQSGKFWRIYTDGPQNDIWLSTGGENFFIRGANNSSDIPIVTEWGHGKQFTPETWQQVEINMNQTTSNFTAAIDGEISVNRNDWVTSGAFAGHTVDYPNMLNQAWRDPNIGANGNYSYDDIYIDYTQTRVELGNASTWAASTKREIQIPVSWSDSKINFAVNQGEFASGSQLYIYVVLSDGSVNAQGFPIRLGNATSAPKAPAAVTVQ